MQRVIFTEKSSLGGLIYAPPSKSHSHRLLFLALILDIPIRIHKILGAKDIDYSIQACEQLGMDPLTQRRVSDLINDLDAIGVVNAKVVSKGRYGRTKIIRLSVPKKMVSEVLERERRIKSLSGYVPQQPGK